MEYILEKLFESVPKARVLRIFMRNPDEHIVWMEFLRRSGLRKAVIKKEIGKLLKIGLIKTKIDPIRYPVHAGRKGKKRIIFHIKKERVYFADPNFPVFAELRDLVTKSSVASRKKLLSFLRRIGAVKLAIIAGVFLRDEGRSRTDLLVVGDRIKTRRFESLLADLESDIGKSLRYTLMETKEFRYRMNMYDRFLRDILEYPHEKLINKIRV